MKIHCPAIIRSAYWRIAGAKLRIEPWQALRSEIPPGSRIAVVGNAGYLHEADLGRQIDDADIVIRMNNFRTRGYERQIGTRVDIVLTNFSRYTMQFDNPDLRRAAILVSSRPMNYRLFPQLGLRDRLAEHVIAGMRALQATQVFVPDFIYFTQQVQQLGIYPTTGMMTLRLILDVLADRCANVFLAGFSFFQGRCHYFSNASVDAFQYHNLQAERREFQDAVHQHGDWIDVDPVMRRYLQTPSIAAPRGAGTAGIRPAA